MHPQQRWPQALLQSPDTVTHLHLYDQHIASLSSIPNLGQCLALTDLNLHSNLLTSTAPSPSFSFTGAIATSLLHLDLSSNQLSRIEGLDLLVNLRKLNLASNRVGTTAHRPAEAGGQLHNVDVSPSPVAAVLCASRSAW